MMSHSLHQAMQQGCTERETRERLALMHTTNRIVELHKIMPFQGGVKHGKYG